MSSFFYLPPVALNSIIHLENKRPPHLCGGLAIIFAVILNGTKWNEESHSTKSDSLTTTTTNGILHPRKGGSE